jgi:hypothetical protein
MGDSGDEKRDSGKGRWDYKDTISAVCGAMTLALFGIAGTSYGPPPGPFWGYLVWSSVIAFAVMTLGFSQVGRDYLVRPLFALSSHEWNVRRIGYAVGCLLITWSVGGLWAWRTQWPALPVTATSPVTAPPINEPTKPPVAGGIAIDMTPQQLAGFYKDRTSVQGDALLAAYVGKWMWTTAKIANVTYSEIGYPAKGRVIIVATPIPSPADAFDAIYLTMSFTNGEIEKVRHLAVGATIKTSCRLQRASLRHVDLDTCLVGR